MTLVLTTDSHPPSIEMPLGIFDGLIFDGMIFDIELSPDPVTLTITAHPPATPLA